MKAEITDGTGTNPYIEIEIDGHEYNFSVSIVEEKNREWLLNIVYDSMLDIHNRAYRKGKLDSQKLIADALGINL